MIRNVLAALALTAGLLAGCTDEAPPADDTPVAEGPALSGFVFDAALRPLSGATVDVVAANASAPTDADGRYRFQQIPRDTALLVTVTLEGYITASKSVSVPADAGLRLNFTLEAVPIDEPYLEVLKFEGFLPCQVRIGQDDGGSTTECGAVLGQERLDVWEFSVGPGVAGIVVEVAWEPSTAAATILNATVETVGYGDADTILAQVEGPSVLRAQVAEAYASRFYPEGGIVRLTVSIGSDADEEAGTSAGAAVDQDFQAFATVFYHAPPPATYSVQG